MHAICSSNQMTPDNWDTGACGKSVYTTRANRVYATSNESKDINIFTDEGDKVTLSYDRQTDASYANLKALSYQGAVATTDNTAVTKEAFAMAQIEQFLFDDSQNLMISVDGDLNDQELADIKEAIKQIDAIMTDLLYGGDISEATAELEEIRNLESLSGIEADYSYEKTVWVEHYAVKEVNTYSEYNAPEKIDYRKNRQGHGDFEKLIEKMAHFVEDSKVKPSKFINPIRKLFTEILQQLNKEIPVNETNKHTVNLIESELIKRIESLAVKETSEATLIMT